MNSLIPTLSSTLLAVLVCHTTAISQPYTATPTATQSDCDSITWCGFTPAGDKVVIASQITTGLAIWPPGSAKPQFYLPDSTYTKREYVTKVAFSNDGTRAATVSSYIVIWDVATWESVLYLTEKTFNINALFTPDGKKIVTMNGFGIYIWDATTGALQGQIGPQGLHPKRGLAMSPDGQHLVVSNDSGRIWSMSFPDGELEWEYKRRYPVYNIQFSPDGSRVLGAGLEDINKVSAFELNASTGDTVCTYGGYLVTIHSVGYHPNGREFITANSDSTVRIWSTETGVVLETIHTGDRLAWVECSPEGNRIVTGGMRGTTVWDVEFPAGLTPSDAVTGEARDRVLSAYPNPAQASIDIPIELMRTSQIRLWLVDALGREIAVIEDGEQHAGRHLFRLNVSELPSGTYRCVLRTGSHVHSSEVQIIH